MWDLRANKVAAQWSSGSAEGVCDVAFVETSAGEEPLVVTCHMGGRVRATAPHADSESSGPAQVAAIKASSSPSTIWFGRAQPQSRNGVFAIGAAGELRILQAKKDGSKVEIHELSHRTVSAQPVNAFDWSADRRGLAACLSFSQKMYLIDGLATS